MRNIWETSVCRKTGKQVGEGQTQREMACVPCSPMDAHCHASTLRPGTLEAHRQINTHAHTLWAVPGTRHDPPTHSRAGEHRFSEADILAVSIRLPSSLFSSWML